MTFVRITALFLLLFSSTFSFCQIGRMYYCFGEAIKNPKQVYQLDLSKCDWKEDQLKQIPSFINLISLELGAYQLEKIPKGVFSLKHLDKLNGLDWSVKEMKAAVPKKLYVFNSLSEANKDPKAVYRLHLNTFNFNDKIEDFKVYSNLKELKIEGNFSGELFERILTSSNLKYLEIHKNDLKELPENFHKLRKLEQLLLFECREFKRLPDKIGRLKKLTELCVVESVLTNLPESIHNCKALQILDLKKNKITKLPEKLPQNLKLLNLERYRKADEPSLNIASNLLMLKSLHCLDLSNHNLREIPKIIYQLKNLEILYLQGNKIKGISDDIESLVNLKVLHLAGNEIYTLPYTFSNLKQLEFLNLDGNNLKSIPASCSELFQLQYLSVNNNSITIFPNIYKTAKNSLWYLSASYNRIDSFELGCFHTLKKLRTLDLSANKISSIAYSIRSCSSLNTLKLSHNKLKKLSNAIVDLKALLDLDLESNDLESLPQRLEGFSKLEKLNVSENKFKDLPLNFKALVHLRDLNIEGIKFDQFPIDQIKDLRSIKSLAVNEIDGADRKELKAKFPQIHIFTRKGVPEIFMLLTGYSRQQKYGRYILYYHNCKLY